MAMLSNKKLNNTIILPRVEYHDKYIAPQNKKDCKKVQNKDNFVFLRSKKFSRQELFEKHMSS